MPRHVTETGSHFINIDGYFHLVGDLSIADGYLSIAKVISDPSSSSSDGYLYAKDNSGNTELYYKDSDGNIVQITSDGYVNASGSSGGGNTLDQAYDEGGSGLGRSIIVDSGPIELNAADEEALSIDGYIGLSEITIPSELANKGLLFTKNVDGYSELYYIDNYGLITQVTRKGNINGLQEDTQPLSPSIYDDEFDGYESLNPRWAWAWGGAPSDVGESWQIKNSRLSATLTGGDSGDDPNLAHVLEQDIPSLSENWFAVTKLSYNPRTNYNRFGICINNGNANDWLQYVFAYNSTRNVWYDYRAGGLWGYSVDSVAVEANRYYALTTIILALEHDSVTSRFYFYYSFDGNEWSELPSHFPYTERGWSGSPTKIGLQMYPDTGTTGIINKCSWEWFRVLSELP